MAVSTRNLNWLIVLGFNDMSTLEGHFVSDKGSKEIEKIEEEMKVREGKKEEQEWKRTEYSPSTLTSYKDSRPCPSVSQYQLDAPVT